MREEHKHPILQKLEEYLKNTPKEQIDKDWSDILKKTDPASYYEKKYNNALERARGLLEGMDEGDYFASNGDIESIFPELKESEDERVRKGLIKTISSLLDNTILYHTDITKEEALAWLEKQGENKKLDADNVIAWLVANICDFEYYVKLFKKDFGL